MIGLASPQPPTPWTLAAAGRAWGMTRQRASVLVNAGRVPAAYRDSDGAWRVPVGTARPETLPVGRPAVRRAA